jgi:hypothetical protein
MKKLKLEVEALHVESFEAQAGDAPGVGTVRGLVHTFNEVSCGCPVTDLAHTCGCPDSSVRNDCFCTEYQTCWNCADA